MPIYLHCECKNNFKTTLKECPKCKRAIGKSKTYKVIVQHRGQVITKTVDNYELAKKIEAKLKTEMVEGQHFETNQKVLTFETAYEKFLEYKSRLVSESHMALFRSQYKNHFADTIAHLELDRIRPSHIEKIKSDLYKYTFRGRKLSNATIGKVIDTISTVYNYTRKILKYQCLNPCEDIERPRVNNEIVRFLTADQKYNLIEVLVTWPDQSVANLLKLLLLTGMRCGEAFKLRWNDVMFEQSCILIRSPKSGRNESIPINAEALQILQNQKKKDLSKDLVFPSPHTGKIYDNIRKAWAHIKKEAEIPPEFRIHDLRHNFASELAMSNTSLFVIQKLLRHRSTRMTMRYAHLSDDALRQALDKISIK